MTAEVKPWEQRPDEPARAYARFRRYLSLGPKRTLLKAFKAAAKKALKGKKKRVSGQWVSDSRSYDWRERAAAWDADRFARQGETMVLRYMAGLSRATDRLFASLDTVKPETWKEFIDGLTAIQNAIPGEVLEEVYRQARAVPKDGGGPAEGSERLPG